MAEWTGARLRDLLIDTRDGDWGKGDPAAEHVAAHVIRGTDFPSARLGNVDGVPLRFLSEKTVHRRILQHDDILIETAGGSRDRPTGRTLLVTQQLLDRFPGIVSCASFARFIRVDPLKANPRYIYWYLQHLYNSGGMWVHQVQHTGVARFQYTRFAETADIPFPSRVEQDALSAVLGALEDKVVANERIVRTVDDLASSLYERLMKECIDSRDLVLGDIADVNKVSVKPSLEGGLRYIDIASVGVGFYSWPEPIAWSGAPGRARRKATFGDTIWSTVRPNRRSHALVLDRDPDLVFSTGLAILSPRKVGPALLYEVTRTAGFQGYLESVAEGSAYPAVRADRFKQAPISLPSPEECQKFDETAMKLRLRSHQAAVESRKLDSLRDTLLPQLMSGKLGVRDAEKIVEDAV